MGCMLHVLRPWWKTKAKSRNGVGTWAGKHCAEIFVDFFFFWFFLVGFMHFTSFSRIPDSKMISTSFPYFLYIPIYQSSILS